MQFNFRAQTPLEKALLVGTIILFIAVALGASLGYLRITALSGRIAKLEADVATTTSKLQEGLDESRNIFTSAIDQQNQKATELQSKFGTISDNVDVLQKLSTLDGQLLKKYSKVYFLNENYMPSQLSTIPKEYTYDEKRNYTILTPVLSNLTRMMRNAKDDGVDLYVLSAYRSFDEQRAVKNEYSITYGAGTANAFSADQGYSEHQLGTTVDFTTKGLGGGLNGFDKTPAYEWLKKYAYRYGFILSYPPGNKYYIHEPWHWRFVGEQLADDLHDDDEIFYDMEQRKLDTYLAHIFD